MIAGDADAASGESARGKASDLALTIPAANLIYRGNDDVHFQGNYDYYAHAQVYRGGADPLGSRGYANVVRHPLSS